MKYQFSLKDECMNELPFMREPDHTKWVDGMDSSYYKDLMERYKKNLASLKSIPVPEEFLNQFEDGKVYDESEFEIKEEINSDFAYQYDVKKFAIPKHKVEDTDSIFLWFEVRNRFSDLEKMKKFSDTFKELKKMRNDYVITRK